MKNTPLSPSATYYNNSLKIPVGPLSGGDSSRLCHNLRPDRSDSSRLRPAGFPSVLADFFGPDAALLPGGVLRDPSDGRLSLVLLRESDRLLCFDPRSGERYFPDGQKGTPRAVLPDTDGGFLIMCSPGEPPLSMFFDSDASRWYCLAGDTLPPPLSIVRKDGAPVSSLIECINLGHSYDSRSTRLSDDDSVRIRRAYSAAYTSIGDRAADSRLWFQPVMARYRLLDGRGRAVFTSATVLVAPEGGVQLAEAGFSLIGPSFRDTDQLVLTARTFSLELQGLSALKSEWGGRVASVELLVTPQFHSLEPAHAPVHSFGAFGSVYGSLRVKLPGIAVGDAAEALRPRFEAALGRLDSLMTPVLTVAVSDLTADSVRAGNPSTLLCGGCSEEIKMMRGSLSAPVAALTAPERALRALSAPNQMCAATIAAGGDTVVASGLSAVRFGGWLPAEFCVEAVAGASQPVPMAVRVRFSDGSVSVRSFTASAPPGAISPLLSYPSADAVELTLVSGRSSLTVPLRPDPSGAISYWLADSLAPISPPVDLPAFILPAAAPAPRRFDGMVAIAPRSNPLAPTAVVECVGAAPVAVLPVPGSAAGWDSGSTRFYLAGDAGLQTLTVNSSRTRASVGNLDSRRIASREAVAVTPDGVMAIASGDLVRVRDRRVTTLIPSCGCATLAAVPSRQELWCLPSSISDNPVVAKVVIDGDLRYTRTVPSPGSILSETDATLLCTPSGTLYDLTVETDTPVPILYRTTHSAPSAHASALRSVIPPLRGEVETASMTLHLTFTPSADLAALVPAPNLSAATDSSVPVSAPNSTPEGGVDSAGLYQLMKCEFSGPVRHPRPILLPIPGCLPGRIPSATSGSSSGSLHGRCSTDHTLVMTLAATARPSALLLE